MYDSYEIERELIDVIKSYLTSGHIEDSIDGDVTPADDVNDMGWFVKPEARERIEEILCKDRISDA